MWYGKTLPHEPAIFVKKPGETFKRNINPPILLILFFILFNFSQPTFSWATIGAPAWLESIEVDKIIHVDQQHPRSSDLNPGNKDLRLKTINAAATLAMRNHKRGFSTKVVIYPGVYREQIEMTFTEQKRDQAIIFEAKEPGATIISGSDIWTEWKETKHRNIYEHHWPHKWGLRPYPPGWEGNVTLQPIVRRSEMVFVDGKSLDQVLTFSELGEGKFFVSEVESKLFIQLPLNTKPSNARVEVAIRSGLLSVSGKNNFVLRRLRFQHDTTSVQGSAVRFSNGGNIVIEDCQFVLNNWTGLGFWALQNVTIRRSSMNYNGGSGFTAWKIKNLLSEDDETSYNNWRGVKGDFLGWGVAGSKVLSIHDAIFKRHTARGNHTTGFWLDFNNTYIVVQDSHWCGNLQHGLIIEASSGPTIIAKTRIYQNKDIGIRTSNSSHVTLKDSYIYSNNGFQIWVSGDYERIVENWETAKKMNLKMEHWTLKNNIIAGQYALFDIGGATHYLKSSKLDWKHFLGTLLSENNQWYTITKSSHPFSVGGKPLTLSDWQAITKQDLQSQLTNLPNNDANLLPEDCVYSPIPGL